MSEAATLQSLLGSGEIVHVHPDHSIEVVVERFGHADGLLPVVSRADVRRVLGRHYAPRHREEDGWRPLVSGGATALIPRRPSFAIQHV